MNRPPSLNAGRSRAILVAMWAIAATVLIALNWPLITAFNFRDPDDALRLVQVRDLLAGQSWFDLTQHRIFPPGGVPMHWSRLVDLPIALMLALLDPLLGGLLAERITLVAIPLGWLLVLCILVFKIARWMEQGAVTALVCVFMLLTSVSIMFQFSPMRIDHHGIQLVCGAFAVMALVRTDRRDGRLGFLAGIAMACWMQISLEGLPYAVMAGGIFALRHIIRTDRKADLRAYMLALTSSSAVLLFATRAPADALRPWCDSLSPSYLVPLGITTLTLLVAQGRLCCRTRTARALPLALAGGAGIATFLLTARQCLAGPFDTLDPLVYRLWYLGVKEGLPITAQIAELRMMVLIPALLGLVGSLLALRRAPHDRVRAAWLTLLLLQLAALGISLTVMRAMSFAHLVALPGNATLLIALMRVAQRFNAMPLRVCLTAATVIATPSGAVAAVATALGDSHQVTSPRKEGDSTPARYNCTTPDALHGLSALPAATLFTPLDIGAHLLVYTHHSVIATGHHRNAAGMKMALAGLTATPDAARTIVAGSGARYLVFCAGEGEVGRYRQFYPHSLMAALLAGHAPGWLEPVQMRPGETIKVYRIAGGRSS